MRDELKRLVGCWLRSRDDSLDGNTGHRVLQSYKFGRVGILDCPKEWWTASSVSFSQNGLALVVSDENGAIRVWQAAQPNL